MTDSTSPPGPGPGPGPGPEFGPQFQAQLEQLLVWRRDVRRFRRDPLPEGLLDQLLQLANLAPSVGLSQPWRFVRVISRERRRLVLENFETANAEALADYSGSRAALYARLKLSGLREAPEQLAVFAEISPEAGQGLGRRSMPETVQYSTVCAIHTLWLAARAAGVGLGWVSILEPERMLRDLAIDEPWCFVAYLCLGYPQEEHDDPELERQGWQARRALGAAFLTR